MKKYALQSQNLAIGYNKTILHDNISFAIPNSTFTCLLGRNGIGKTTLLRVIAGLEKPIQGSLLLDNKDIQKYTLTELAKKRAWVSTHKIEHLGLTVRDVLYLGRYPHANFLGQLNEQDKNLIDRSIELFSLTNLIDKKLNQLSDGQRQKIMLARALIQDTDIIVLDEPSAHLDFIARIELFKILKTLSETYNKTILIATHELEIALRIANHCVLMTPEEVIDGKTEDILKSKALQTVFSEHQITFDHDRIRFSWQ